MKRDDEKVSFWLNTTLYEKWKRFWKELPAKIPPTNQREWLEKHVIELLAGKDPIMQRHVKQVAVGAMAVGIMGVGFLGYKYIDNLHRQGVRRVKCSDFQNFYQAQKAYKEGAYWLDRGGIRGVPCESLPK